MAGNSILEDINDYNKVAELFENVMKPDQERENDDVEGFGYHHGDGVTASPTDTNGVQAAGKKNCIFPTSLWNFTSAKILMFKIYAITYF